MIAFVLFRFDSILHSNNIVSRDLHLVQWHIDVSEAWSLLAFLHLHLLTLDQLTEPYDNASHLLMTTRQTTTKLVM